MITATILSTLLAFSPQASTKSLVCPVMGEELSSNSKAYAYAGMRMSTCCASCEKTLKSDPMAALKKASEKGWVVAESLFDPVSGDRVNARGAKGTMDFKGVRYYFTKAENMANFKEHTAKYTAMPKKESMICPVSGETIANYAAAGYYRDYEGVRYYICCAGCIPKFDATPGKFAANVASKLQAPHFELSK